MQSNALGALPPARAGSPGDLRFRAVCEHAGRFSPDRTEPRSAL